MAMRVKNTPACARCAALEDWINKALRLLEMIAAEWPGTTWLQRQIARARAQCPLQLPAAKEER
jgi:hypothetical protein